MLLTTNSFVCNASTAPQFIMAHLGSASTADRSRSPLRGEKPEDVVFPGEKGGEGLEDNFSKLWASQLEPKLAAHAKATAEQAAEKNKEFEKDIQKLVGSFVKTEVDRLEKKLDNGLADVNANIAGLATTLAGIQASLASPNPPAPTPAPAAGGGNEVRQALRSSPLSFSEAVAAGSQQSAGNDVTTPNFNRKLNPTKLFCNLHDRAKVAKAKFEQAISISANEANLSESDYKVVGDPLDNRFELQFAGDIRIASVCALQFYDSLHLGRGLYKDQFVVDDQNKQIKFYVNPDKNPCQMRREILSKHLRTILASKVTDKDLYLKKTTGSVLENKRAICSVIITGPESARLEWCHPKRIELGIEQAPVEQEFSAFVIGGGPGS